MVLFSLVAILACNIVASVVVIEALPMTDGRDVRFHNFLPSHPEELANAEQEGPLDGIPLYPTLGSMYLQQGSLHHPHHPYQQAAFLDYQYNHQNYHAMQQQQQQHHHHQGMWEQSQQQQQYMHHNYPPQWPGMEDSAGEYFPEMHPVNVATASATPPFAQLDPDSQHASTIIETAKRKQAILSALAKYRTLIGSNQDQMSLTCRRFVRARSNNPEIVDFLNSNDPTLWQAALEVLKPKRVRGVRKGQMQQVDEGVTKDNDDGDGDDDDDDDERGGEEERAGEGGMRNIDINIALAFQNDGSDNEEVGAAGDSQQQQQQQQQQGAPTMAAGSSSQAAKGKKTKKKREETLSQWYMDNYTNTNRNIVLQHICDILGVPEGRAGFNVRERWRKRIQRNSTDENISGLYSDNTWTTYHSLCSLKSKNYHPENQDDFV